MPRMSKKRKHELSFYLNDRGRVTYNELCRKCKHGCKQSFRAVEMCIRDRLQEAHPQLYGALYPHRSVDRWCPGKSPASDRIRSQA